MRVLKRFEYQIKDPFMIEFRAKPVAKLAVDIPQLGHSRKLLEQSSKFRGELHSPLWWTNDF